MRYKLLALDLDGTLLDENHLLTEETVDVINKIRIMGVNVIIATGRMYISALPFINKLNLSGPMVTYNGSFIKNKESEEILYHKTVNKEIADLLIKEAEENNLHIQMYHDDNLYVNRMNEFTKMYEKIAGVSANFVEQLTDITGAPTKLLIIENEREKFKRVFKYFKDKYGQHIEVTESLKNYIELGAKGVTKGKGLDYVAKIHNIERDEIVAAGDSWNDFEMIKWAGTGIAMNSAPEKIKDNADIVAPPEKRGGLNQVLKDIFNL